MVWGGKLRGKEEEEEEEERETVCNQFPPIVFVVGQ